MDKFSTGNIVHVIGFTSSTSTGEVVDTDGRWLIVHFDDGETTAFLPTDLRLPRDDELYVYLFGHTEEFIEKCLAQQPSHHLTVQSFNAAFPTPQFFVGQCVMQSDFGTGVVISRHDEDDAPYYLVSFGHCGEPVPCDGFELSLANAGEIDAYAGPNGLDLDRDVIAHMKSFLPKEN